VIAMATFDEVIFDGPDGTTQRMTHAEFFKLTLAARVEILVKLKPRFFKGGDRVSSSEAMK
jgi:hypothetical protein